VNIGAAVDSIYHWRGGIETATEVPLAIKTRSALYSYVEDAIRKMTSANAAKIHQYDRGLLHPRMAADVTVFNPATIIDHATYEKPHQYSTGVEYVVVNGKVVLDKGQHNGARPGTILYGQGKTK